MPSYTNIPLCEMTSTLASPVVSDIEKTTPSSSTEQEETFVICKRTSSSGRIRNLRSGEPESVERTLPKGEHPMDFFVTNYIVAVNGFNAPYRAARLEEKETNWVVAQQTTPTRSSSGQRRPMRRPSGLFGQPAESPCSVPICPTKSHEPCPVPLP